MTYSELVRIVEEERKIVCKWIRDYFKEDIYKSMTIEELYKMVCGMPGIYPSYFMRIIRDSNLKVDGKAKNESELKKLNVRIGFY